MKLEVVVIPVSDAERATKFYTSLGWRQDVTPPGSGVVQSTPPGSGCSVQWGAGRTTAAPGSAQGLWLIVSDIQAALDKLAAAGVKPDDVFHIGARGMAKGLDPERNSYRSFASFPYHDALPICSSTSAERGLTSLITGVTPVMANRRPVEMPPDVTQTVTSPAVAINGAETIAVSIESLTKVEARGVPVGCDPQKTCASGAKPDPEIVI
jgi:catechol 2,3-dioxygenase-like lactoylglutathione lyase family enzyme